MGDSDCSEDYDTDDFYQMNGHAYFDLDRVLKQQRILAETKQEEEDQVNNAAGKPDEAGQEEEVKAVGADDLNNPEQQE